MSDQHSKLLRLISDLVKVDPADLPLIKSYFMPVSYTKGEVLIEAGQVARHMYFIDGGYLRLYYLNDGLEITSHINCPLGFITSFNSFISQTPAPDYLECITACDLLTISKKDFDDLLKSDVRWAEMARTVNEQVIVYNEQRTKDMIRLSAEERYIKLLREQPDIIQNVPLQYIASFIGVKPESLSRIRKKVIS
jgi:CRP-like cAMP-binding protein